MENTPPSTPLTIEQFTEAMRTFGDRMDARFDSMDKKFDDRFKKVDERFDGVNNKFAGINERLDQCATKEQFTLLEKGIAEVAGRLLQMENNMRAFVLREELPQDILSRLKTKNAGAFAVRDGDGQGYNAHNPEKN